VKNREQTVQGKYVFFTPVMSVLRYEISSYGDRVGRERRGRSNVSVGVLLRDRCVSLGNIVARPSRRDTVLRDRRRANRQPRSDQEILGSLVGTLFDLRASDVRFCEQYVPGSRSAGDSNCAMFRRAGIRAGTDRLVAGQKRPSVNAAGTPPAI